MSDERRVVVTGMGVLSALGDSPRSLHEALCEGRSGVQPVSWEEADGMPELLFGRVEFDPRTYLPDGNLRPLDRTGRLAVASAGLALADAGWTAEALEETEVGFVAGTMFGSVHTIAGFDRRAMEAGPNYAKPMEFANSVINAAAGQTAIWHNLWGINATISGGTASGAQAIAYASDLIRTTLLVQGIVRAQFTTHLGDLLPQRIGAVFESRQDGLGMLVKGRLVFAGHEDFQQLEIQIFPLGIILQGILDQIFGLLKASVGQVYIGLGQRISFTVVLDGAHVTDRKLGQQG